MMLKSEKDKNKINVRKGQREEVHKGVEKGKERRK